MEYTKQDYKNAIGIFNDWSFDYNIKITFADYIEEIIDELEKPEILMYRCIQTPPNRDFYFKVDELYNNSCLPNWFYLSDLPNHFELVEPEPKPEKITWWEELNERIKTDHL